MSEAITIPSPRRSLEAWVDLAADGLMALMLALLIFRIPGSLFMTVAGAAILLLILPLRHAHPRARLWLGTLGVATAAASLGTLLMRDKPEIVNFATITVAFVLVSCAVLLTEHGQRLAQVIVTTCYWCFGMTLLIGLAEIVTGFRVSSIVYPDQATTPANNAFDVSAFYPNYNDFSVILAMFATMVAFRIFFDNTSALRLVGRVLVLALTSGLIVLQGSRGALLALLLGVGIALWLNLRINSQQRSMAALTIVALLLAAAGALVLWTTPWVQDNSTMVRGKTLGRIIALTPDNSLQFWVGWGTEEAYKAAAKTAYPGELMDPHNVAFEAFIWYGLPAAALFAVFWLVTTWRGVWCLDVPLTWRELSAVTIIALMPIFGIVPSSTFRYYLIFVFGAAAAAAISHRSTA
ncbi:MAG: hypothetical protein Q4D79_15450 [Propionibacteriaceae bacterium]|nr:hypothetical protein [Propionibacteriaceae bacterium]